MTLDEFMTFGRNIGATLRHSKRVIILNSTNDRVLVYLDEFRGLGGAAHATRFTVRDVMYYEDSLRHCGYDLNFIVIERDITQ